MKRPSFQFYPGDWRSNAKLRRCTEAARGAWMDILCVLHDAEEYGVLRWPLADVARAAGVPLKLVRELVDKAVLKGADAGAAPYVFAPSHAGKLGEQVTLVAPLDGPCWYSSRFVRDEWVRQRRGSGTRFGDDSPPPKATPEEAPKFTPTRWVGARQGDGPSSSSSSAEQENTPATAGGGASPSAVARPLALVRTPNPPKSAFPDCQHMAILGLWREVLPHLPQHELEQWRGARADHLRARWREAAAAKGWTSADEGLTYFRRLFAFVGQSLFLTGRVTPREPGRKPFVCTLAWLVKPENWAKTIEGEYHPDVKGATA